MHRTPIPTVKTKYNPDSVGVRKYERSLFHIAMSYWLEPL